MGEIKKLSELDENQIKQAVDVFIDGFYHILSNVSKDKNKLRELFKCSFDYDMTYAYLQDGTAIGFLGLADHKKRPISLNREVYIKIIGGFAGKSSYKAVSGAFEKAKDIGPLDIFIDYIATSPEHRSKGVGTQFIAFVRDVLGYKQIQLETYSKNKRAVMFYERLGFKVIKVKKSLFMALSGYGSLITLRFEAE
ncbi:MAG: GNAT family N-acetyltransferase [Clostridiales bacterium]|nr:GNAT family N-acetyltransferase [Clostridiales bacterium]